MQTFRFFTLFLSPVCIAKLLEKEVVPGGYLFHRGLTFKDDSGNPENDINLSCSLQAEVGPCKAAVPQWYHDMASASCKEFVWGGCEGNANRYASLAACERSCGVTPETCFLPPDPGNGTVPQGRYFYEPMNGVCEQFLYYGHGGNRNNWFDEGECEFACDP